MPKPAKNRNAVHKRGARGADPIIPEHKSRTEIWRPGHVAETLSFATEENSEALPKTKGKPAVRARIKPAQKKESGE